MTRFYVAGPRLVTCLFVGLTLAILPAAACSHTPINPQTAILDPPAGCESLTAKSQPATTDGASAAVETVTPFSVCVEEIDRGYLRFDWSRITLDQFGGNVACVRLAQTNGHDLGYDNSGDRPNRTELELAPNAGRVQFIVSDDPDGESDISKALGNALGDYDLKLELFERGCPELCRGSRGHTTIAFSKGQANPAVRRFTELDNDCGVVESRAPATWNQGGAGGANAGAANDSGVAGGNGGTDGGDTDGGGTGGAMASAGSGGASAGAASGGAAGGGSAGGGGTAGGGGAAGGAASTRRRGR